MSNWLTSDAFNLQEARSLEAEHAIMQALRLGTKHVVKKSDIDRVDHLLRNALGDIDRFWMRWTEFKIKHGYRETEGRAR